MPENKKIMILGTASSSGKSLIAAALCRLLMRKGIRVAPFKAQNMSNNSFVTKQGGEMGRAQVVQSMAAGIEPDVRMNPVLLKPSSDTGSQVVIHGKAAFTLDSHTFRRKKERLRSSVKEAYFSLCRDFEAVVMEGAGSPAEINLMEDDIVNMGMADMADSPAVIVGDIDRGGVFASLYGTIELLPYNHRERIKGIIINKFRGDRSLLTPGLEKIEELTKVGVAGVVPWFEHNIDDEDSVTDRFSRKKTEHNILDICVIKLPYISNFTDFSILENTPGVNLRYETTAELIDQPDLVILPGSKSVINDLKAVKYSGIAEKIEGYAESGGAVAGICGGFQMLGKSISDPYAIESNEKTETGLRLLDMETSFRMEKETEKTDSLIEPSGSALLKECTGLVIKGYEIHMGQSDFGSSSCVFSRKAHGNNQVNGITNHSGNIIGTYLHGIFDNPEFTSNLLNNLAEAKGYHRGNFNPEMFMEAQNREIDRLADEVENSVNMDMIYTIMGF